MKQLLLVLLILLIVGCEPLGTPAQADGARLWRGTVSTVLRRPLYVLAPTSQGLPVHLLYQKSSLPKKEWM